MFAAQAVEHYEITRYGTLAAWAKLPDLAAWWLALAGETAMVAAAALGRRVQALRYALDHLPQQARRLARWKARRELERQAGASKPGRLSPFRPGYAPGYHRTKPQEVDDILSECHHFAREAWEWTPDTS